MIGDGLMGPAVINELKIKCVVWDLDNTIWKGVLAEDSEVCLQEGIFEVIKELDNRGILQSISSKNNYETAMNKLKEFGIDEYFLYPQISWNPKSEALKEIANLINININTLAFIDDQPFELEEVRFSHPEILTINVNELDGLLEMPALNPRFITEDSKSRRQLYMNDIVRNDVEKSYSGTKDEFLATLGMSFTIAPIMEDDLKRAEELTVRTHQLNATGYTYSYEELDKLREVNKMFIADLNDKYGDYGKIGLSMIETENNIWNIKLLIMSCRVMSRSVGTVMLNHIMRLAKEENVRLLAEFVPTEQNRIMYITYKFAGFKEIEKLENGVIILECDLNSIQSLPAYIKLNY